MNPLKAGGLTYGMIDIHMRMLASRELFNAERFPADYVIKGAWEGLETGDPLGVNFSWTYRSTAAGTASARLCSRH